MSTVKSAVWEFVEAGGRTAQTFGFNRLLGQIYALLYLSHESLSLDDLVEQLGVSKASVSISCRQLMTWGVVKRVWKKGDRKDYYEAETDLGHLMNNGLLEAINKKLTTAKIQIEHSLHLLEQQPNVDSEQLDFVKQRLREAERYRERITRMLNNPLVKKLL